MTFSVCITHEENDSNFFYNQWSYSLNNFRPDKIYILGIDSEHSFLNYKIFQVVTPILISSYNEIVEQRVFLSPQNSTTMPGQINLKDFTHPETCCYIFGANNSDMSSTADGDVVYIPTSTTDNMFNWVTYSVLSWDRST